MDGLMGESYKYVQAVCVRNLYTAQKVPHEEIRLDDAVAAETHPVLDLHLGVSAVDAAVVAVVVDVARHPAAATDVVALESFQFCSVVSVPDISTDSGSDSG